MRSSDLDYPSHVRVAQVAEQERRRGEMLVNQRHKHGTL